MPNPLRCIAFSAIAILLAGAGLTWASDDSLPDVNSIQLTPVMVIGEEDGDVEYLFGRLAGLAVDGQGRIYAGIRSTQEVRVFSPTGEFVRNIGREGEGPGEFQQLSALRVAPDGRLLAADGNRVHVFEPDGTPIESFATGGADYRAYSIDAGPDGTTLVTWYDVWNQKVLHVYDVNGERIASHIDGFGSGLDLDATHEQAQSGGFIDYDPSTKTLLYAQLSPIAISLYDSGFGLLGTITGGHRELDRDATFTRTANGYTSDIPTICTTAMFLPGGEIFHATINRDAGAEPTWFTLAEVFGRDGTEVGAAVLDELVEILTADAEGYVYAYAPEPFPQIRKYRVELRGE